MKLRLFSILLVAALGGSALAQTTVPAPTDPLGDTQTQLRGVQDTIDASAAQRRKIEAEVESLRADRTRLMSALLATSAKVRAAETTRNADTQKLLQLTADETALRKMLDSRRDVLAQVLAALQRMGRKPPPAVLVRPEDMLAAIHSSILLGDVLPQMSLQAQALAINLRKMIDLQKTIITERDNLEKDVVNLKQESVHLDALVKARQQAQAESESALSAEQKRATILAAQAKNLADLIHKIEKGTAASRIASDKARKSDTPQSPSASEEAENVTKLANNATGDAARLAPAVTFISTKGTLNLPAIGQIRKSFGENNGFGGTESGDSVATEQNSIVFSPVDCWVLYSGPYRSYGKLIILNAGEGYYIVLAGMQHIDVSVGQFVLGGEPLGKMGGLKRQTAASLAIGANVPILYIEFRKDGSAIDPGPWWAKSALQKVRG